MVAMSSLGKYQNGMWYDILIYCNIMYHKLWDFLRIVIIVKYS